MLGLIMRGGRGGGGGLYPKEETKCVFKGTIFLKNRYFIIEERLNKLIYGINTIIKCGTWQPVKFS